MTTMNSTSRPGKAQPGERVAGHRPERDVAQRHGAGHDQAVEEQPRERRVELGERRLPALEDDRLGDDGQAQRVGLGLERGDERPGERHEHQQPVPDQEQVRQPAAPAGSAVARRADCLRDRPRVLDVGRNAGRGLDGHRQVQLGVPPKKRRWISVIDMISTNSTTPTAAA